jgi:hypothetical protein
MPAIGPPGWPSHRLTSQPRCGRALRSVLSSVRIRRRDVEESPTTRSRATTAAVQPRLLAISGASRAFRSRATSIACASGITDLTSTTSRVPLPRWKPEDVDRAAFAADRERRLDGRVPAGVPQPTDERLDQVRMRLVEQPIQSLPVPANPHVKRCTKCLGRSADRRHRDAIQLPPFDARDRRPRDSYAPREVDLAPAPFEAQRTDRVAEPDRIHDREHDAGRSPGAYRVSRRGGRPSGCDGRTSRTTIAP